MYTDGQGVLEGALRYWALPHCPGPFSLKALFLIGLEDSWLRWGGAKPLALIPLPTHYCRPPCCPVPHSPTGLQLWGSGQGAGQSPPSNNKQPLPLLSPWGGERPGFGFSGSMNTQRYTSYHRRKQ